MYRIEVMGSVWVNCAAASKSSAYIQDYTFLIDSLDKIAFLKVVTGRDAPHTSPINFHLVFCISEFIVLLAARC